MTIPTIKLNSGYDMPHLGFGVWQADNGEEAKQAVLTAIETGYRLIDTAAAYENEESVGEAIKESGVDRNDLFITTKLWNRDQANGNVRAAFMESLRKLDLDYIDLYLIHWPMPDNDKYVETWQEFEKLRDEGLIRSIGVSNFEPHHLEELKKHSSTIPAVNQVELHPRLQQKELRAYAKENGIQIESWSPIGGNWSSQSKSVLDDTSLQSIAEKHEKTVAQVILRWHIQSDLVAIPKSVHAKRIKENFDVFDFELSGEDMQQIKQLDSGERAGPHPDSMHGS